MPLKANEAKGAKQSARKSNAETKTKNGRTIDKRDAPAMPIENAARLRLPPDQHRASAEMDMLDELACSGADQFEANIRAKARALELKKR